MPFLRGPDGAHHDLAGEVVTIGRDASNDVVLADDQRVSRAHAELRRRDGQWLVVDLGSRNGTLVNERKVQTHPLVDGDRVRLGASSFTFVIEADPRATVAGSLDVRAVVGDAVATRLSDRERQVVALVADGLTDQQIAERLFISPSTVRSHLDRVADKTGLRRRPELTRLAVDLGLVD